MMWKILVVLVLIFLTSSKDERPQYTENIQIFKKDKHKQRLELLVGCWLMSREYHPSFQELQLLSLIKECLKHITRKDSVVKITSLIGKNMTSTKSYHQVVPSQNIPNLGNIPLSEPNQLDKYLLGLIANYEKDLKAVNDGQGEQIRKRIDQEMQKKKEGQYYFGIIPVNQWTHLVILITISIFLVLICTCWKYFQMRKLQDDKKKPATPVKDYFKQSGFTKGKVSNKKKQ